MLSTKSILKTLVSQNSTRNNELAIAEYLEGYLSGMGLSVRRLKVSDGRFNVYAFRNASQTDVLWYGHMDTVPAYENWQTDPFRLKEKDGRYYGLGVCDMKGGIAALLSAVAHLDRSTPVRLLFCVDEEYDSEGAWQAYSKHPEIFSGVNYLISMEPGASRTKVGGSDVLTLGRRGRARLLVKVHGVSAHGAHPERGVNAVDIASELANRFRTMELTKHAQLGDATHFIASFKADAQGLSLPEYCEFEVDRHLVTPDTVESALASYQAIAAKYLMEAKANLNPSLADRVTIEVGLKPRENSYMLPFVTDRNDPFIKKVEGIMSAGGKSVVINYGKSVGDENVFTQLSGLQAMIIGPEGGDIHAPNEWVSIASLHECEKIYQTILKG